MFPFWEQYCRVEIWRRSIREALTGFRPWDETIDRTPVNLLSAQPAVSRDRILLIEGIHDLFTPPQPIEERWQTWGRPEIWRLPQGHISLSLLPGLTRRVLSWLAPRLGVCAEHQG